MFSFLQHFIVLLLFFAFMPDAMIAIFFDYFATLLIFFTISLLPILLFFLMPFRYYYMSPYCYATSSMPLFWILRYAIDTFAFSRLSPCYAFSFVFRLLMLAIRLIFLPHICLLPFIRHAIRHISVFFFRHLMPCLYDAIMLLVLMSFISFHTCLRHAMLLFSLLFSLLSFTIFFIFDFFMYARLLFFVDCYAYIAWYCFMFRAFDIWCWCRAHTSFDVRYALFTFDITLIIALRRLPFRLLRLPLRSWLRLSLIIISMFSSRCFHTCSCFFDAFWCRRARRFTFRAPLFWYWYYAVLILDMLVMPLIILPYLPDYCLRYVLTFLLHTSRLRLWWCLLLLMLRCLPMMSPCHAALLSLLFRCRYAWCWCSAMLYYFAILFTHCSFAVAMFHDMLCLRGLIVDIMLIIAFRSSHYSSPLMPDAVILPAYLLSLSSRHMTILFFFFAHTIAPCRHFMLMSPFFRRSPMPLRHHDIFRVCRCCYARCCLAAVVYYLPLRLFTWARFCPPYFLCFDAAMLSSYYTIIDAIADILRVFDVARRYYTMFRSMFYALYAHCWLFFRYAITLFWYLLFLLYVDSLRHYLSVVCCWCHICRHVWYLFLMILRYCCPSLTSATRYFRARDAMRPLRWCPCHACCLSPLFFAITTPCCHILSTCLYLFDLWYAIIMMPLLFEQRCCWYALLIFAAGERFIFRARAAIPDAFVSMMPDAMPTCFAFFPLPRDGVTHATLSEYHFFPVLCLFAARALHDAVLRLLHLPDAWVLMLDTAMPCLYVERTFIVLPIFLMLCSRYSCLLFTCRRWRRWCLYHFDADFWCQMMMFAMPRDMPLYWAALYTALSFLCVIRRYDAILLLYARHARWYLMLLRDCYTLMSPAVDSASVLRMFYDALLIFRYLILFCFFCATFLLCPPVRYHFHDIFMIAWCPLLLSSFAYSTYAITRAHAILLMPCRLPAILMPYRARRCLWCFILYWFACAARCRAMPDAKRAPYFSYAYPLLFSLHAPCFFFLLSPAVYCCCLPLLIIFHFRYYAMLLPAMPDAADITLFFVRRLFRRAPFFFSHTHHVCCLRYAYACFSFSAICLMLTPALRWCHAFHAMPPYRSYADVFSRCLMLCSTIPAILVSLLLLFIIVRCRCWLRYFFRCFDVTLSSCYTLRHVHYFDIDVFTVLFYVSLLFFCLAAISRYGYVDCYAIDIVIATTLRADIDTRVARLFSLRAIRLLRYLSPRLAADTCLFVSPMIDAAHAGSFAMLLCLRARYFAPVAFHAARYRCMICLLLFCYYFDERRCLYAALLFMIRLFMPCYADAPIICHATLILCPCSLFSFFHTFRLSCAITLSAILLLCCFYFCRCLPYRPCQLTCFARYWLRIIFVAMAFRLYLMLYAYTYAPYLKRACALFFHAPLFLSPPYVDAYALCLMLFAICRYFTSAACYDAISCPCLFEPY